MSHRTLETLVGGAVVLAAALFLVIAFTGGRLGGASGYRLEASYDQVDGVSVGSPVLISGLKVGEVEAIRLDRESNKPVVTMRIQDGVEIPTDSAALILSDGLLGDKYLKIDAGSDDEMMGDGDQFEFVQDAVIVEQLLERIVREAEARRKRINR